MHLGMSQLVLNNGTSIECHALRCTGRHIRFLWVTRKTNASALNKIKRVYRMNGNRMRYSDSSTDLKVCQSDIISTYLWVNVWFYSVSMAYSMYVSTRASSTLKPFIFKQSQNDVMMNTCVAMIAHGASFSHESVFHIPWYHTTCNENQNNHWSLHIVFSPYTVCLKR